LFAVKALARTGDLDKAPLLLYALTDGDPRVRRAADEGLRFLSRKLNGFGDWDDSKPEQLEKIRLQWRDWLLAIRPTAELLE
jgi:HEAT repeat protein